MTRRIHLAVACAVVMLAAAVQVRAALLTFDLEWSGASFGNSASATGFITLDDTLLPNPGNFGGALAPIVTALEVTVVGASSGNGTFLMSDFSIWIWDTDGGTLDLGAELVGQPTSAGLWAIDQGDFNLGSSSGAPSGYIYFELTTNSGSGDPMRLTSFSPVPEPSSLVLVGMTLAGVGLAGRRRRKKMA